MNTPENDDIHKLLRLKKHEQPPPGYFGNFLTEFQRRQRAEMLKRSVWQLARERVQAFFETGHSGTFGYAAATAAVLVVASLTAARIVTPRDLQPSSGATAMLSHTKGDQRFALELRPSQQRNRLPSPTAQPSMPSSALSPHYVIDARPVSYEPPFSF